ncbi:MAG: dehydrogenase [Deltaproteobacteria bacterium]|jgi:D-glycero-alpha-D-manno-heptose-7-phosphate kinase|nr:dehydrogenase [Deltaproteobacteria bacterium]MCL5879549.1 dehydrogenase [Deltaproteobacteria bacterium]
MIHSKAPLRLGLAGGGTDVSPYSDTYGGAILNATISMYAYAVIEPLCDNNASPDKNMESIILNSIDREECYCSGLNHFIEYDGNLDLIKAVYNRIVKDFTQKPLSFKLSTYADAPAGSGLGTSSTLVVAIIGAFAEWLKLPLGEYDIAHLAYEIERVDLNMAGGKQDQYSATFGGFNFMEFYDKGKVIVNPLRIKREYINELQFNILLYYLGTSRLSSGIIKAQAENVANKNEKSIEAMHRLKEQSAMMKEAVLKGNLDDIGEILNFGWKYKKQMAECISNPLIDEIYETALKNGATGGKITGAGGGGFMMFYCPRNTRYNVIKALQKFGGEFRRYQFTEIGLETWNV